jgi:hypothetical protein
MYYYIFLRHMEKWNLHDTAIQMEVTDADFDSCHKSFRELVHLQMLSMIENMSSSLNNT